MAITYGFYNSVNHDRRYNAVEMSSIFDGIIRDGVYQSIGQRFQVTPNEENYVKVGTGRAWFNHTWTLNDNIHNVDCGDSEILLNRYDAIVLQVDSRDASRKNSIICVHGTPANSPSYPTLTKSGGLYQYPLAYVYRKAQSTTITTANITNAVGTSACPFVTGVLSILTIDMFIEQWGAQWNEWLKNKTNETYEWMDEVNGWIADKKSHIILDWNTWFNSMKETTNSELVDWISDHQDMFIDWFDSLQVMLDDDAATNIAKQIANILLTLDIFIKEGAFYKKLQDSDGNDILDDNDNPIYGSVRFATMTDLQNAIDGKGLGSGSSSSVSVTPSSLGISNYIISEETKDGWKVRKWNNGIMEIWKKKYITNKPVTTQVGSLYYGHIYGATESENFPYNFVEEPDFIDANIVAAADMCWISLYGPDGPDDLNWDTEILSSPFIVSPESTTISQAYVYYHIKGRWK